MIKWVLKWRIQRLERIVNLNGELVKEFEKAEKLYGHSSYTDKKIKAHLNFFELNSKLNHLKRKLDLK